MILSSPPIPARLKTRPRTDAGIKYHLVLSRTAKSPCPAAADGQGDQETIAPVIGLCSPLFVRLHPASKTVSALRPSPPLVVVLSCPVLSMLPESEVHSTLEHSFELLLLQTAMHLAAVNCRTYFILEKASTCMCGTACSSTILPEAAGWH